MVSERNKIVLVGCALSLFILLGNLFPEKFWGVHFIYFLQDNARVGLLVAGAIAIITLFILINKPKPKLSKRQTLWLQLGFAAVVAITYFQIRMFTEEYGDGRFIAADLKNSVERDWWVYLREIFTLNIFDNKLGTRFVFGFIYGIAHIFGISPTESMFGFNAFVGGSFVFLWLRILSIHLPSGQWFWPLAIAGIMAPFHQMFIGHAEIYAPIYVFILLYGHLLITFLDNPSKRNLIWVAIGYFLCFKGHVMSAILFPSLLYVIVRYKKPDWAAEWFTWRTILLKVTPVFLVAGLVLYGVVFNSFYGPRSFGVDEINKMLFIPMVSNEPAPMDRYNLFSFNHIFDYVNIWFFWSIGALFLTIILGWNYKRYINWNSEASILVLFTFILFFLTFFVINPLLTMPIDWDLFCIPASWLLISLVLLYRQVPKSPDIKSIGVFSVVFGLVGFSFILSNENRYSMIHRVNNISIHGFKTYHIGTSTSMRIVRFLDTPQDEQWERLRTVRYLEQYAIPQRDKEFGQLVSDAGKFYLNNKQLDSALFYLQKARIYSPKLTSNLYRLFITHFYRHEYEEAVKLGKYLTVNDYPDPHKAHKMALHASLMAKNYEKTEDFCFRYLKKFPEEKLPKDILQTLRGPKPEEAVLFFHSK